jgi:hypothetical protein
MQMVNTIMPILEFPYGFIFIPHSSNFLFPLILPSHKQNSGTLTRAIPAVLHISRPLIKAECVKYYNQIFKVLQIIDLQNMLLRTYMPVDFNFINLLTV